MLANNVSIIGGDHKYDIPGLPIIFSGRSSLASTIIGKDVWIGAHCIIKAGVQIGDGAIVAMGSVVVTDIDPFSIYAGVPAKKIRDRFKNKVDIDMHSKMLSSSLDLTGLRSKLLSGKIS